MEIYLGGLFPYLRGASISMATPSLWPLSFQVALELVRAFEAKDLGSPEATWSPAGPRAP